VAQALMITRRELKQQAMRQGVALGALEKDYILTLILRHLYAEQAWHKTLVFKGGTALHKLYLGRRLSLDLDFTASEPVSLEAIRPVFEIAEIQGRIKDTHEYHDALTINRLGFVGPLQHPNSIKIDISFREEGAISTSPDDTDCPLWTAVRSDLHGVGRDSGRKDSSDTHAPYSTRLF
jgi:predicted nucleotidyltransferase component of viral defense system